ncbi:MAG: zeta toxin family protein [Candidatus Micrarchaeaceae archaeon]
MSIAERSAEVQTRFLLRPSLTILTGLPASGKSTIGNAISKSTNAVYLDIDRLRNVFIRTEELEPFYGNKFPDMMEGSVQELLYRAMYDLSEKLLDPNYGNAKEFMKLLRIEKDSDSCSITPIPVVTGATHTRQPFHSIASEAASRIALMLGESRDKVVTIFRLFVSDEEAGSRLEKRAREGGISNVTDLGKYSEIKGRWRQIEGEQVISICTKGSVEDTLSKVLKVLVRKGVAEPIQQ